MTHIDALSIYKAVWNFNDIFQKTDIFELETVKACETKMVLGMRAVMFVHQVFVSSIEKWKYKTYGRINGKNELGIHHTRSSRSNAFFFVFESMKQ